MNYKLANTLCSVLCTIAVLLFTLIIVLGAGTISIICGGLGFLLMALGLGFKLLFFRCPRCGKRLPMKGGSHCPNCGKML